jgi:hypothetical protein
VMVGGSVPRGCCHPHSVVAAIVPYSVHC